MTLDEAIARAENVADEQNKIVFALNTTYNAVTEYSKECSKCAEDHRQLAEWLRELKELREQTRWIPVDERTPEDRRTVLVTAYWHETYQVMMGSYYGDGLWWCVPFNNCGEHMQKLNPKAWMPLLSEYQGD